MNPSSGPEPRDNAARGVLQATILASMVLVPAQVARVMFVMGLKGEPLLAAGIIVGIGLAMHLVLKARHQHKRIAFWIASWSTGGLCFLAGLLALFSLDAGNVPTVVVLTTVLLAAYFTAQLLVNVAPRDGIAVPGTGGRWLLAGTGGLLLAIFVVQWIVPATIQLPLHLDTATSTVADATWFLCCGPLFLVAPLVHASATSPAAAPGTGEATSDQPAPASPPRGRLPVRTGVMLAGTTALFTMLFKLFVYATLVAASRQAAVAHLGIAAGATGGLAVARATRRAAPLAWIAAGILAISFAAFATSPDAIHDAWFMLGSGAGLGVAGIAMVLCIGIASKHAMPAAHGWLLVMLLVTVGSGFLAGQLRWLVRDHAGWLLPASVIVAGAALAIAVSGLAWRDPLTAPVRGARAAGTRGPGRVRGNDRAGIETRRPTRAIKVATLAMLVAFPVLAGVMYSHSRTSVTITLPASMYTVDGRLVSEATLPARSALVLLYHDPAGPGSPSPGGPEAIRPGKSVRLGAYFYGGTEAIDPDETAAWIGDNVDVFALGGWPGYFFNASQVATVRAANPAARYYIMTFATTFGSVDSNPDCASMTDPTVWGCSFNETMHGWTLKYNDGTEAYGVRRGPGDPCAHLMDLGSEGWARFYAWFYDQRVQENNANGVAIDEVMWNGYWGTDVSQLRDYSSIEEITASCYEWLRVVHENMASEIITQAFWPDAQQHQDGVWGELSFRCGGAYGGRADDRQQNVFYETMNWQEIVENMHEVAGANKTYIWAAWYRQGDRQALEYAIATYLMGKPNNCTWLGFHPQPVYGGGYPENLAGYDFTTVKGEVERHPEFFDLELGQALGPMTRVAGRGGHAWQREFEHGIVLVNPYHAQAPGFQDNDPVFAPSN